MKTVPSEKLSNFSNVIAHFTTRHGGVSKAPFHTNNLAFHVGDNPEDVIKNHDLLAQTLHYPRSSLVYMRQIHSDKIVIVDDAINFDTPPECDALITNQINLPLMVMSADCTPILLYDSLNKVVACVHAGRAGALNGILPKTIQTMQNSFATDPKHLIITLGPSIHGCCYQINENIANEVREKGLSDALRLEQEEIYLDVNTILLHQLKKIKIPTANIEVIDECTACNHHTYFSYRANSQYTGRIAGLIMLRDSFD